MTTSTTSGDVGDSGETAEVSAETTVAPMESASTSGDEVVLNVVRGPEAVDASTVGGVDTGQIVLAWTVTPDSAECAVAVDEAVTVSDVRSDSDVDGHRVWRAAYEVAVERLPVLVTVSCTQGDDSASYAAQLHSVVATGGRDATGSDTGPTESDDGQIDSELGTEPAETDDAEEAHIHEGETEPGHIHETERRPDGADNTAWPLTKGGAPVAGPDYSGAAWPSGGAFQAFSDWCFGPLWDIPDPYSDRDALAIGNLCTLALWRMTLPSVPELEVPQGCLLAVSQNNVLQWFRQHNLPDAPLWPDTPYAGAVSSEPPTWADCPSVLWPESHITAPDAETTCRYAADVLAGVDRSDPNTTYGETTFTDGEGNPYDDCVSSLPKQFNRCQAATAWAVQLLGMTGRDFLGAC
ncbi:MAG: hypothetical protein OXT70_12625 [Chloroflexota bacterium]|nr:hypothetical protein [Chloroflexota bacterium]